jgi:Cu-processing system permease protein
MPQPLVLLAAGIILSFVFTAIAFLIALRNENRIKGFGLAILAWLFFAVLYDGIFLIALLIFKDYPLDTFSLVAIIFNPIDLARILVLLKLDISALFGYSGAVFEQFLGSVKGSLAAIVLLLLWISLPTLGFLRVAKHKDF